MWQHHFSAMCVPVLAGLGLILAAPPVSAQYGLGPSPNTTGGIQAAPRMPSYYAYFPGDIYVPRHYFADPYTNFTVGNSPTLMTSINFPGVYGAATYGVAAERYNTRPYAMQPGATVLRATITPYSSVAEPTTPPPAVTQREAAYLDVRLPSDAKLYVEGVEMSQTGYLRQFVSPPLDPFRKSTYNLRATWEENGKPVEQLRTVRIRGGDHLDVDMLAKPAEEHTLEARPLPELPLPAPER
jgi:uncharacterized protein (TIGR03000 family)